MLEELFVRIGGDPTTHLLRSHDFLRSLCPDFVRAIEEQKASWHEHEMAATTTTATAMSSSQGGKQHYSVQHFEAVMKRSIAGWSDPNKRLHRLFAEHDEDRDGILEAHEFLSALRRLHIDPREEDLHRLCSAYAPEGAVEEGEHVRYSRIVNRIAPDEPPKEWHLQDSRPSIGSGANHKVSPEGLEKRLRDMVALEVNPRWRLRKLFRRHAYGDPSCLTQSEFTSLLMEINVFPDSEALDKLLHAYESKVHPECLDTAKLAERVLDDL